MKGLFIVFEGIDGSGKTTQLNLLANWLKLKTSYSVECTREPGGSAIGAKIRQLILENSEMSFTTELLLFAADRVEHIDKVIKPALDAGSIVLSDRFTLSTEVYQGWAKTNLKAMPRIVFLNQMATNGVTPDLTIIMDLEPSQALSRIEARGEKTRFEKMDIENLKKIRHGYLQKALTDETKYFVVDAAKSLEQISLEVQSRLLEQFKI